MIVQHLENNNINIISASRDGNLQISFTCITLLNMNYVARMIIPNYAFAFT